MKLNLLPKTVSKSVASKMAFVAMLILVVLSLVGAFALNRSYNSDLQVLQEEATAKRAIADKVVQASKEADVIMAEARIVLTNMALVEAIKDATNAYPDLYDELREYVPSWFRVRTINASSTDGNNSTVEIDGYLRTFQQYSDVMIALLRHPDVVMIGRSGFGPVPSGDEGPFGYNPEISDRGPIPGYSAIRITLLMQRNLQAPDPLATLRAGASGAAPAGAGAPGPGGRTGPPGTAPSAGGGAPRPGGAPAAGGGGRPRGGDEDDL